MTPTETANISDTLVTPFGNIDLPTDYDAIANLDPTESFAGLDNPSQHLLFGDSGSDGSGGGSIPGGDNAFTLGGLTYDPGDKGWGSIDLFTGEFAHGFAPLTGTAPLLELTPGRFNTQDFDLYAGGDEIGTAQASVDAGNLLGIELTQFTVTDVDPADSEDPSDALPANGTTYSVLDFGGGFENVYQAVPNSDGDAAASITDTLVTPFGNLDVPTDYDAISGLDAGSPFAGLGAGDVGSDNAVTFGEFTYDPGSDGWDSVEPLYAAAPLLAIGGGQLLAGASPLATQILDVYDASGDQVGATLVDVETSYILGIDTTQFTVDTTGVDFDANADDLESALSNSSIDFSDDDFTGGGFSDVVNALADFDESVGARTPTDHLGDDLTGLDVHYALFLAGISVAPDADFDDDDIAAALNNVPGVDALPEEGTVYSVTDFGGGFENVYVAVPNADGDAAASLQDTLVTPFGNVDLSTMFDAIADLMPGDAAAGVSDAGSDLFGGLF